MPSFPQRLPLRALICFLLWQVCFETSASAKLDSVQSSNGFMENKGQITRDGVRFVLEGNGMQVFLLESGIAYQFSRYHYPDEYANLRSGLSSTTADPNEIVKCLEQVRLETFRMNLELVGMSEHTSVSVEDQSSDFVNYYTKGVMDVHHYKKVTYHDVYPGIDWVFRWSEEGSMKYEFVVKRGTDPSIIQLKATHHEELRLETNGNLVLSNRLGQVTEQMPVSFQGRDTIATRFKVKDDIVRFQLGAYDSTKTLIIDPTLVWATYYGYGNLGEERGSSCSTDADGNVYMAGYASSTTGLASNGHQNISAGLSEGYLVKFNSMGVRQWATYFGGPSTDHATHCATDPSGNVYLCGFTQSLTGIAYNGFLNTPSDGIDAFLAKFTPDGQLLWSTYYGDTGSENGTSCTTDNLGNVYLSGYTSSTNGISFAGHQPFISGPYDAFVVKFNPDGQRLWATYVGGGGDDKGMSSAVDSNGNFCLTGFTDSPTGFGVSGHQNNFSGGLYDGFLTKFNTDGQLQWSTYYGGAGRDHGTSCATDALGNVYLGGATDSGSDIAQGGHQNNFGSGTYDGFLAKFTSSGTRIWATYYGGSDFDWGTSCGVDAHQNIFLSGYTESPFNISAGGHQNSLNGEADAFLVKFKENGQRVWATYYGGAFDDESYGMSIDSDSQVYLAGTTESNSQIAFNGFQNVRAGGSRDAFLAKFDGCATVKNLNAFECDSIVIGGQTFNTPGSHTVYLANANSLGCDSIVRLYLGLGSNTAQESVTNCDSLTWNTDGTTYYQSGNYEAVMTNAAGCDSTITLDLTLLNSSTHSFSVTECDLYSAPDGSIITNSGQYSAILTNSVGCDSIINLEVVINPVYQYDVQQASCDSFVWNGQTYIADGQYLFEGQTVNGCDSVVMLNLDIRETTSSEEHTACKLYNWNGQLYTVSGDYSFTTLNSLGCDSTANLDLTITLSILNSQPSDQTVLFGENALFEVSSNLTEPMFQWQIDDGLGFTNLVNGLQYQGSDTAQLSVFSVTELNDSLFFRCIGMSEVCTDTSETAMLTIIGSTGIDDLEALNSILVSPNPTSDWLTIDIKDNLLMESNPYYLLVDLSGREVRKGPIVQSQTGLDLTGEANGNYILTVFVGERREEWQIIKQ